MNPRPQSAAPQAHEYVSDSKSPNGATTILMGTFGKPTPLYTFAAGVNTALRATIGAWSTKKKALVFGGLGLVLVAVVVGVAAGASTYHNSSSGSSVSSSGDNPPSLSPVPSPTPDPNPNIGTLPANHNSVAWAYLQVFANYGAIISSSLARNIIIITDRVWPPVYCCQWWWHDEPHHAHEQPL